MVNITAIKQLDGIYKIEIDEFLLNEVKLALTHLNTKRVIMNKNNDKYCKEAKGENYVRRVKKRKEALNLVIVDSIDYVD
jgi:hypothetical protein